MPTSPRLVHWVGAQVVVEGETPRVVRDSRSGNAPRTPCASAPAGGVASIAWRVDEVPLRASRHGPCSRRIGIHWWCHTRHATPQGLTFALMGPPAPPTLPPDDQQPARVQASGGLLVSDVDGAAPTSGTGAAVPACFIEVAEPVSLTKRQRRGHGLPFP